MLEAWLRQQPGRPNLYVHAIGKLGEPIPLQISMFDTELTKPDVLVYAWADAEHIRMCRSFDGTTWADTRRKLDSVRPGFGSASNVAKWTILRSYVGRIPTKEHLHYGRELARRFLRDAHAAQNAAEQQMREAGERATLMRSEHERASMLEAAWNAERASVQSNACALIAGGVQCSPAELIDTAENLASPPED